MQNTPHAIAFSQVTKHFPMQTDRTAKEMIPALFKGSSWAKYHTVFSNLSFTIEKGETVGIVGRNGAGKSTILKLIAGVTYPTHGSVIVSGQVAPLIELGAGFHHELSGMENIYLNGAILGMSKKEIEQRIDSIIEFSELGEFINTPVKRYSSGMMMRLGFSIAVQTTAPVLLIDEVLAVGDVGFQRKCLSLLEKLKRQHDKTIIFVSHAEDQVKEFCERAILLEHGKILLDGKPETVFKEYNQLMKVNTDSLPG
jgi:ABC-type polysaccharide/polyol phosphate transport system ATPase subunit